MILAIDIIDGCGLSNVYRAKEDQTNASTHLPLISQRKVFNQLHITNKMECFSFQVGVPSSSKAFKRRLAYNVTVI